jgi:hypothetical protein
MKARGKQSAARRGGVVLVEDLRHQRHDRGHGEGREHRAGDESVHLRHGEREAHPERAERHHARGGVCDGPAEALREIHHERPANQSDALAGDEERFRGRSGVKPAHRNEQQKRRLPGFEDAGEDSPPLLGAIGGRGAFGRAHQTRGKADDARHCLSACKSSGSQFTVGR